MRTGHRPRRRVARATTRRSARSPRSWACCDEVTDGFSEAELIKGVFDGMSFDKIVSWEEFQEKDYFVVPYESDWQKHTAGWYEFYKDPEKNPLPTPTGKLEFYSREPGQRLPQRRGASPIPKWIEKGITHDERISSTRAKVYPLLVMSNHGRWRVHAQCDDIPWTKETVTGKIKGWDGYLYEPCWMHPERRDEAGASRTATSSRSTTSAAECSAARWCGSGSCRE